MKRFLSVCSLILLLAGCATTANYQKALSSWRGANINQLVSVWGYPTKRSRAPDGNRLYIYHLEERGQNPIYHTGPTTNVVKNGDNISVSTTAGSSSGGGTYDYKCTTWVEVDRRGTIVNTAFRGNNCLATESFVKTHSNPNLLPLQ